MKYPDACLPRGLRVDILPVILPLQSGVEIYRRDVAFGASDS